jgi:hypothetical protein
MSTLYNFVYAQRLLIKPFDRVWFIVVFVSATAICSEIGSFFWPQLICQAIGDLCLSQAISAPAWVQERLEYSIVTQLLTGILTGTMVGCVQWLVLRRYLSTWKWILATVQYFTIISIYQAIVTMWRNSYFTNSDLSASAGMSAVVLPIIIINVGVIVAVLIGGYIQWYVLRPYVTQARWWILVPLIATIVGGVPIALRTLLPLLYLYLSSQNLSSPNLSLLLPPFSPDFISLTMLPATQAIGFCALNKKSLEDRPILQTPLAVATDITNYWEIERIKRTINIRISRIWKNDLEPVDGKLTYLVGVDRNCTQIAYEPMDRNSLERIALTPFPELVESANYIAGEAYFSTAFAKFRVVLAPPGTVEIKSWRGIPLKWLALATYLSIMGMSILVIIVAMKLFPLSTN